MGNPRDPLTFDDTFHVYNHAVGDDCFFREERNYYFFMEKFIKWILPVTNVLAYCLIPNHFHFCLRIKSRLELQCFFKEKIHQRGGREINRIAENEILEKLVNEQFSHCFNSYAQAYNRRYCRMGSLFKESFQRKQVTSDDYLIKLICYINNNPVHHGIVEHPAHWKHSSYNELFCDQTTIIERKEVIELFDSLQNLEFVHLTPTGLGDPVGVR
ncbi:MAG: hypothetical protein M3Q95_09975 [Bacteroidota bacterium]|nr:hypothetical protein [Bacteroidota bacterium]